MKVLSITHFICVCFTILSSCHGETDPFEIPHSKLAPGNLPWQAFPDARRMYWPSFGIWCPVGNPPYPRDSWFYFLGDELLASQFNAGHFFKGGTKYDDLYYYNLTISPYRHFGWQQARVIFNVIDLTDGNGLARDYVNEYLMAYSKHVSLLLFQEADSLFLGRRLILWFRGPVSRRESAREFRH